MSFLKLSPLSQTGMIDALKGAADIIEEVSDTEVYFGFCLPGTKDIAGGDSAEEQAAWSIMKIEISGSTQPVLTTFKWAYGLCSYSHVWADRADYDYTYKAF